MKERVVNKKKEEKKKRTNGRRGEGKFFLAVFKTKQKEYCMFIFVGNIWSIIHVTTATNLMVTLLPFIDLVMYLCNIVLFSPSFYVYLSTFGLLPLTCFVLGNELKLRNLISFPQWPVLVIVCEDIQL